MPHAMRYAGLVVAATLLGSTFCSGQEWTRFRGPNGSGVSDATGIPIKWTQADYQWKSELPGIGHSSPVVWGDRVFLLSADLRNATRYVLCLEAGNGKVLWQHAYPSTVYGLHPRNTFASSTPVVDQERLYVAWATPDQVTLPRVGS